MDTTPQQAEATSPITGTTPVNPVSSAFYAVKAKRRHLDQLMARYDVHKISPRDIDTFVESMLEIGQPLNADMLMFASFGERFLDHLAEITEQPYDATKQVDMLDVAKGQRDIAKRAGDDTGNWDQFIDFLTVLQDRALVFFDPQIEQGSLA